MSEILVNSLKTAGGVGSLTFDSTGDVLLTTGRLGRVAGNTITIDSDGILNAASVNVSSAITLPSGAIDSAAIGTGAVSANKIASGAVEGAMTTQIGGRRNLIINGAMQVAQRGTSATGINSNQYTTVDRWTTNMNSGGGTWTVTQESSSGPDGFPNSAKVECTTATGALSSNEKARWEYRIEGQDVQHFKWGTSAAESITISFWVKSNKTGTYIWEINNYDGTNTNHICKQYTINSSDTWEYKTLTVVGDTDVVTENVNGTRSQMYFHLVAGTNFQSGTLATAWATSNNANRAVGNVNLGDTVGNYWQITGVQLEVGTVATPFEHRSYGEELALCQRYYTDCGTFFVQGYGYGTGSDGTGSALMFPTTMRATPSMTKSGQQDGGSAANLVFNFTSTTGVSLEAVSTNNTYSQWAYANVTADAEL